MTKHGHALAAYVLIIVGILHWEALSRLVDQERAAAAETAPEED